LGAGSRYLKGTGNMVKVLHMPWKFLKYGRIKLKLLFLYQMVKVRALSSKLKKQIKVGKINPTLSDGGALPQRQKLP
jgi:hypothetical protein